MKKFTLLLICLFTFNLYAQISITSGDIIGPGKVLEIATNYYPPVGIDPGPGGANQTWDFSTLSVDDTETILTLNPSWTPYGMFFPGTNLAMYSTTDSVYMYMENSASAFGMHG